MENNLSKTKFFTVVVEGATTDGRKVSKQWIKEMAQNYDPKVYCAQINIEHIRAYSPSSTFKRYGTVNALRTTIIKEGVLEGKLALQAQIIPTPELIALNKAKQKLFTSVEIAPEFADTKSAYLVGLAVTDDPASLGTEILHFSQVIQNNPFAKRKLATNNVFSASELELNLNGDQIAKNNFSNKLNEFKHSFTALFANDNEPFNNDENFRLTALNKSIDALISSQNDLITMLTTQQQQIKELLTLNHQFAAQPTISRPLAAGVSFSDNKGY